MTDPKLIVVVGPTGSGKSTLALKLAQTCNGEIINADSKAIYQGMNIGTAKPTESEMLLIPHHLVNIKNPNEPYSAAQFQRDAQLAIADISRRGKLPIMVGGTGLYIDSVLFNYQFPDTADPKLRMVLVKKSLPQLVEDLDKIDPSIAEKIDLANPRRVTRALELVGQRGSRSSELRPNTLVLGLSLSKESIRKRLEQRLAGMLDAGLVEEVRTIGQQYGWDSEAMTGLAYRVYKRYLTGELSLDEANAEFTKQEVGLAKRQLTWFKRNQAINWVEAEDPTAAFKAALGLVKSFLTGSN